MIVVDEQKLLSIVLQLWVYVSCHPIITVVFLLFSYLLFKFLTFSEIVVDLANEVPHQVRQLPGQKSPPFYPNGWIPILESRAIVPNQVKSVLCFGTELAVIRTSSGQIYVIDAFCPHLGANLAVGGTVHRNDCNEDCIRCPFHGWSFRMSDGLCSNVPYEDAPVNAKVNHWPVKEVNQAIFVWFHADRQEPTWEPAAVEEIASSKWVYQGRTEHFVNCHLQEIPENGADVAHLGEIHVDSFIFGSNLNVLNKLKNFRFFKHEWQAQWNPCPAPHQHKSYIELVNRNKLFGFTLFTVFLRVNQIGPAYVELRLEADILGGVKGIFLQFVKPVGQMRNSIIHQVYTDNTFVGFIFAKFLLYGEAKMLERDIMIWNRKAFLKKPYVSKTEKSLVKYRRWFSQFYSQDSIDW